MTLTDDDIRAIVARAEALQRLGDIPGADAEALIRAGEELGISRSAMQRAVRERLGTRLTPAAGDLVFARSADDRFYAAEVLSPAEDGYRVRFLSCDPRSRGVRRLTGLRSSPRSRAAVWPSFRLW